MGISLRPAAVVVGGGPRVGHMTPLGGGVIGEDLRGFDEVAIPIPALTNLCRETSLH